MSSSCTRWNLRCLHFPHHQVLSFRTKESHSCRFLHVARALLWNHCRINFVYQYVHIIGLRASLELIYQTVIQFTKVPHLSDLPICLTQLKPVPLLVLQPSLRPSLCSSGYPSSGARSCERITPSDGSTSSTDPLFGGDLFQMMQELTPTRLLLSITESSTEMLPRMEMLCVSSSVLLLHLPSVETDSEKLLQLPMSRHLLLNQLHLPTKRLKSVILKLLRPLYLLPSLRSRKKISIRSKVLGLNPRTFGLLSGKRRNYFVLFRKGCADVISL